MYKDSNTLGGIHKHSCSHKGNSKFQCIHFSEVDCVKNRRMLYKNEHKIPQDIYLSRLIYTKKPRRSRKLVFQSTKQNNITSKYYLIKNGKRELVCKAYFMKVLSITKRRIEFILKRIVNGGIPSERRGGDHRSHKFIEKKESVNKFINSFPAIESHYNRSKSKRIYLNSNLNISKMFSMYNESVDDNLKVSQTLFRQIFLNNFNIGFSSPASDVCTVCHFTQTKIKNEVDPLKKIKLMTDLRIHKLRANAFYGLMREKPANTLTIVFDMQSVQMLPKCPIQEAYYSRQIGFYNLCFVGVDSKNPSFYCWTENQAGRGSSEIGSALFHYLNTVCLKEINYIRLFCDGCGGQNKNSHIVRTILFWLQSKSPSNLRNITITFPVRGHSFLPADRVFGRIEKDIKRHDVITTVEEYCDIYSRHGKILLLEKDWTILNIKDLEVMYKKIEKIQDIKRIVFNKHVSKNQTTKCLIKTFKHFKVELDEEQNTNLNLLKRGKTPSSISLTNVTTGRWINADKIKDVTNLLKKQFGNDWIQNKALVWYKELIYNQNDNIGNNTEEDVQCGCIEEDIGRKV